MTTHDQPLPDDRGSAQPAQPHGRVGRVAARALWVAVIVALALSVAARWQLARTQPLDFDEYQHLHVAWCWTQGMVPYRDFWDNHPPLLHVALAGIQGVFGETTETIFTARATMFVLGLLVLAAAFVLARTAFDTRAGVAATALLACVQVFTEKTAEIRPDSGLILFGLLSTWLLVRVLQCGTGSQPVSAHSALSTQHSALGCGTGFQPVRAQVQNLCHTPAMRWSLGCAASGAMFGLATLFSTKSTMLAAALAAGLTVLTIHQPSALRRPATWFATVWWLIGLACVVLPVLAYFGAVGGLANLLHFTILDNVTYPERFPAWRWLEPTWSWPMAAIFALGLLWVWFEPRQAASARRGARLLVVMAVALLVQFAVVMPAPHAQSACLSIAFLAIPGGRLLAAAVGWVAPPHAAIRRSGMVSTCAGLGTLLAVLAGPGDSLLRIQLAHHGDAAELQRQLAFTHRLLKLTGPDDAVFSDAPWAIFRKHACFYPTLTYGVLARLQAGRMGPSMAEDLRRHGCTLVAQTHPPRPIPGKVRELIGTCFVTLEPFILVPGRRFAPQELAAGPVTFEAIAAGVHRIEPATAVVIDGQPVTDRVVFDAGRHTIAAADGDAPPRAFRIIRRPGQ